MKMNENKSSINSLYQEIGKKVYEKHLIADTIDIKAELEDECTKIDVLSAEIETFLNQIRELKDKKQCPKCFKEIALEAKFCNYCGAEQEAPKSQEAYEAEVVNTEVLPENETENNRIDENTTDDAKDHLQKTVEKECSLNSEESNSKAEESNNEED